MAEDEVAAPAEASPVRAPSDLKRKLEELEAAKEFEEGNTESSPNHDHPDSTALESEKADVEGVEAKRPKLVVNESDDGLGNRNGFDSSKFVEGEIEGAQETKVENEPSIQVPTQEASQEADKQEPAKDNMHIPSEEGLQETDKDKPIKDGILIPSEGPHLETDQQEEMAEDYSVKEASQDNNNTPCFEKTSEEGTVMPSQDGEGLASDAQTTSRKIEVPNDKVGVLIGKGGDTIRYLQYNSGAKIQITRDAEADPSSTLRSVELIGTLSSIDKAEKLINAVMAEADAGGSPSLVARGLPSAPSSGGGEQLEIQVPNEKVGLIIGRGGDTIKGLQAKSGARIQLIPQHLPEGDGSRERIVRVTGDKKQIEIASEMIKDVMNQTVRPSPMYGGFNQQQPYRPRGPIGPNQWGPRGPHSSQPMPYDGQHRGPYPHFSSQYPPPNYANYPPQMGPRSNYGSSWEQRNHPGMRGPHGGGYDYYGSQGGHASNRPVPGPISYGHGPSPSPAMGPPPPQANYNYGQQHGANYGPYSRGGTPHQSYGHGYDKPKYDNPTATQPPYGNANSQPFYPQTSNQAGYGMQPQQYGRPPSYSMPSQGPPPQLYVANQAGGEVPYQAPAVQASQSYGSNVPPHQQQQQQYPTYASSAAMQAPYGAASGGTDGYNQMPPASNASYPQQAAAAAAYGQVGGQQSSGYMQGTTTSTAGYGGAYATTQQGYAEQSVSTSTGYGAYQDPTYAASVQASGYGAQAASGQQGYAQAAQGQANYDQSVPQGAYGSATGNVAAVNYGKTVSPQAGYPQYDTSQMYGGAAAPQTQ